MNQMTGAAGPVIFWGALGTVVFAPLVWTPLFADTPRLAPVLAFFLTAALMALPRVAARARADGRVPKPFTTQPRLHPHSVPVIVVGQLERIEPFTRELSRDKDRAYTAVAILTDAADLHGRHLHGVAVLGAPDDLGGAMAFLAQRQIRPQRLIIADDRVSEERISEFLDMASAHGMSVGILPRLIDFADHGAAQAMISVVGKPAPTPSGAIAIRKKIAPASPNSTARPDPAMSSAIAS